MSTDSTDLQATWAALANEARTQTDLRVRHLPLETDIGPVFAGRDLGGCDHLLIAIDGSFAEDRQSAGVHVLQREFDIDGTRYNLIDVACRSRSANPVFHRLVDEIYQELRDSPDTPLFIVHNVLGRWRELLAQIFPSLGPGALAGLFGELWWLRRVIERDPDRSVDAWRGPLGEPHDLRRGSTSVEVKTTTRREGRFVEIHGAEQLVAPEPGRLFLGYTRLTKDPDGQSVPGLVEALIASGVQSGEVVARLEQLGWRSDEIDNYDTQRFTVTDHDLYAVDDAFPRVVPGSFLHGTVPPGVLGLRSTVDLTGPYPRPLTDIETDAVIADLAGVA
jgi:Putative  PD-(D/E)XK family member, (DUF4420)